MTDVLDGLGRQADAESLLTLATAPVSGTAAVATAGVVTLVLLVAVALGRRVVRARVEAIQAARWQAALDRLRRGDVQLGYVQSTYQLAARGCKAIVSWDARIAGQDTWFRGRHLPSDHYVLTRRGPSGWGPHNRDPSVRYVAFEDVLAVLPGTARVAWEKRRTAGAGPRRTARAR